MKENAFYILLRYIFLALIGINLSLFYLAFTPLTIYPVKFLLSAYYKVAVSGNTLFISNISIKLVDACIAGSAYYLLLLLNFSVPMGIRKRALSLIFSFLLFLFINIIRIFLFSLLFLGSFQYFDIIHLAFWYILSGLIVFLVWIFTIKIFSIKEIPFYSDIRFIYKLTKHKALLKKSK